MREILFRGKRPDDGEWVEGAFCMKDSDSPFGDMVERPSIIKYDPPFDGFWFRVNPKTVGQYIGVVDVNGKKIFEGDIVQHNKGRICRVYFSTKWGFSGFDLLPVGRFDAPPPREYELFCGWKIIGNIYDNPELLVEVMPWEKIEDA